MHPLNRRQVLARAGGLAAASAVAPLAVHAQGAPMRIVVGYPPGGGTDRAARIVAERLQKQLNRTVLVENRVGAGGRVAAQQLVNAPADPPVLMIGNPAVMSVAPMVYKDLKYDPKKDFVPVAGASEYEFGIAVGSALPLREVSHMMAWMRANPEKANAGVPGSGSLPHFFGLMLSYMAQVKIEVVAYRGSAPLLSDLMGGQIPISIDTLDSQLPQHEGRKIRILATSGAKRSPLAPEIPTFKEQGLPLVATGWNLFFTPATTPRATVDLFSKAISQIMAEPDTRSRFLAAKMIPLAMDATQTAAHLRAFNAQWDPVIRRSGFKGEA